MILNPTPSTDVRQKADDQASGFPDPACIAYDDFFNMQDHEIIERDIAIDLKSS